MSSRAVPSIVLALLLSTACGTELSKRDDSSAVTSDSAPATATGGAAAAGAAAAGAITGDTAIGGTSAVDSVSITDIDWTLSALGGTAVADVAGGRTPTLRLTGTPSALRATGAAGCNRYNGTATLDGRELRFGPLAATKMACPALDLEGRYLEALGATRSYRTSTGKLDLLEGERVLASFTAPS